MNKRSEFQRAKKMWRSNPIFPHTRRNKVTGWFTSNEPLSILQTVGLLVFYPSALGLLFVAGDVALTQFHNTSGTGVSRVVAGFGGYVIILALIGAVFLLLRWRIGKALASPNKQPPFAK